MERKRNRKEEYSLELKGGLEFVLKKKNRSFVFL